jgi:hypothetical protein
VQHRLDHRHARLGQAHAGREQLAAHAGIGEDHGAAGGDHGQGGGHPVRRRPDRERHPVPGRQPGLVQAGGQGLDPVGEPADGAGPAVGVDQPGRARLAPGPGHDRLDQVNVPRAHTRRTASRR